MNVTYRYLSLAAIADYFDNKAIELRARVGKRVKDTERYKTEAAVYESVAYMLRNTELSNDELD